MTDSQTFSRKLSDEDVALFLSAIGVAPRQMRHPRQRLTKKYNLGPRGTWILGMIKVGINSPSRLSEMFYIGRSLLTAELNRVVDAGLVVAQKQERDRRRLTLFLTPEGEAAQQELARDLEEFVNMRLAKYSREEVLLCTRLLRDFAGADPQYLQPESKQDVQDPG